MEKSWSLYFKNFSVHMQDKTSLITAIIYSIILDTKDKSKPILLCKVIQSKHPDNLNQLPDDKILDWFKLKQIAYDILKCIYNERQVPYRVENIVRKGEIACYMQFLLFSKCFLQLHIFSASKCGIVW